MTHDYRTNLHDLMARTLADRAHWHYRAVRPCHVPTQWSEGQSVTADCSKAYQMLCRWAGIHHDPMNRGWDPWGNSSTLAAAMEHLLAPSSLLVGDCVTVGPGGRIHAAMVMEPGLDPVMWSFGHQGAPNTYRLSADHRWPKQYLHLAVPVYTPTPEDRLRAMTGYWAWLQWTLGEGSWRPYQRFDKTVRPNVPRLIPPSWWRLRVQYMLDRRRGNKPTVTPA